MMNRRIIYGLTAGLAGLIFLGGCRNTANQEEIMETTAQNGLDGEVTGNGDTVSVRGNGVSSDGNIITVTKAGSYRLSGTVSDGRIVVDAGKEDQVQLILDGFSITSPDFSAIYAKQCGRLTITLKDGTENMARDGAEYVYANTGEDEPDAAIFSKDDLVLEGNGTLTVNGRYQHGIRGKDDLTVKSGEYGIESVNDGIKGTDSVVIEGGTLTISAGGDGIQSSNDAEADKGYVKVSGGALSISAKKKGIQAETLVEVAGGSIQVESEDDSLHSNGDISISAGTMTLSSGDDAIHGDSQVEISGGELAILKSYEGVEGLCIDIAGGQIQIASEDDGMNAAGGNDSSGNGGRMGGDPFTVTEGAYIRISGGTVTVEASGDGIDSNGDLFIEGGEIYVEGPEGGGNGALDYNGAGTIAGGVFIGTGSSGMFQSFSENSTQPVIHVFYTESLISGIEVAVTDSEGNVLASARPSKNFTSLIFSSPELEEGKTYQVSVGDETTEITIEGIINESGTNQAQGGLNGFRRGDGNRGGRGGAAARRPSKPPAYSQHFSKPIYAPLTL